MKKPRFLYVVLGIVGMTAWFLFILGCLGWSSWSPDSSKVIFPYIQQNPKSMGIALYDRMTHKTSPIFIQSADKDDDLPILQAQWATNGKSIVITVAEESEVDVFISGVDPDVPTRHTHLGRLKEVIGPFAEVGGDLYFPDEHEIVQLNIESGNALRRELKGASYDQLFAVENDLLYLQDAKSKQDPIEVGTVNLQDFQSHSLFQFNPNELGLELRLGITPQPGTDRFAMVAKNGDKDSILIFSRHGFERLVHPQGLPINAGLGNVQWSKDGTLIYAGIFAPIPELPGWQYSLAEVSLDGAPTRITPICKVKAKNESGSETTDLSDLELLLDLSLSPDGKTIATIPALFDSGFVNEIDRALFLIDVQTLPRTITKIPTPNVESSKTGKARRE